MSEFLHSIETEQPFTAKNITIVTTPLGDDGQFLYGNWQGRYIVVRMGVNGEKLYRSPLLTGSEKKQLVDGNEWLNELRTKILNERLLNEKQPAPTPPTTERLFTFD